ncbi:metal-dependent hydrolase [Stieleria sp. JC731]|uniref:metal-dependent hydrolase n=1 Tax=Pirellulaceae TaxID=2691357 RepID=UPI001E65A812|nr:metal-dependent hydrolase [Stieleria sp. JC731]MCC9600968.1 metal-dependent hydrolase [Stieleria sp. JC731]
MDIATHALIGTATAAGLFQTQPALAVGLVLGNVAPDLDALSRVTGKHAFLRFHQTYTHSVGAIAMVLAIAAGLLILGLPVWGELAMGLVVGMVMHVGLDLTNSYGVKCLWPFSQRRFALDWIFFIDAFVIALSAVILIGQFVYQADEGLVRLFSVAFILTLILYVGIRCILAFRARRLVKSADHQTVPTSIIPTTWSPFRFLVCRQKDRLVETFTLNARSGSETDRDLIEVLDQRVPEAITECREWLVMRSLSDSFVCVEIDEVNKTYTCRDLRIRNFGTKFGMLTCQLDDRGVIQRKTWDV